MTSRQFIKTAAGAAVCAVVGLPKQAQALTWDNGGDMMPNPRGMKLIKLAKVEQWLRNQPAVQWQAVRGVCNLPNYQLECVNTGLCSYDGIVHSFSNTVAGWWLEFGIPGEKRLRLVIGCRAPAEEYGRYNGERLQLQTTPRPVWFEDAKLSARNIFEDPAFWQAMQS